MFVKPYDMTLLCNLVYFYLLVIFLYNTTTITSGGESIVCTQLPCRTYSRSPLSVDMETYEWISLFCQNKFTLKFMLDTATLNMPPKMPAGTFEGGLLVISCCALTSWELGADVNYIGTN